MDAKLGLHHPLAAATWPLAKKGVHAVLALLLVGPPAPSGFLLFFSCADSCNEEFGEKHEGIREFRMSSNFGPEVYTCATPPGALMTLGGQYTVSAPSHTF